MKTTGTRPIQVLIVDDAPQVREGLRTLLPLAGQAAGQPVVIVGEVGDGSQAVEQADTLRPDVVLMDLEMPGMDGYAATREIKSRWPSTRVVVLSVHGEPAARQKALESGADEFVVKGTPMPALMRALRGTTDTTLMTSE